MPTSLVFTALFTEVVIYLSGELLSVCPAQKYTDSLVSCSALWLPCLSLIMERRHPHVLGIPLIGSYSLDARAYVG